MKRIAFYAFFALSYAGTAAALYFLVSGRFPVFRFLLFMVSIACLDTLGMKNGRNGLYRIPGYILTAAGAALLIYCAVLLFNALLIGLLYLLYGLTTVITGILVTNHL